jgi:alpha-beta hydrolase superfamily lysophospholipase
MTADWGDGVSSDVMHDERTAEGLPTGAPFWLDVDPEPIQGVLHTPASGVRTRIAALILPTFGWDNDCSYRPRRVWATTLAEAGIAVVRFDFPGTENSVGSPLATGRFQSWVDATVQTARWLRELSGCDRLVAIGIGLGGLVAYQGVAVGAPIDDLVLWGTRASGRAYMREQRAYAAIVAGQIGDARTDDGRADGAIGIGGHTMSAETADVISSINLLGIRLPQGELRRVLLLGRDAHGVDDKLRRHLEESGAAVTVTKADDYYRLVAPPDFGFIPTKTIAASVPWLLGAGSATLGPIAHVPAPVLPEMLDSVEFEHHGQRIRERVSEMRTSAGRLVGIISEPTGRPPANYSVVIVNSGALRHTGPNRMFVEIARRAAASGVPAARFDLPGLGDSDGHWVNGFERTHEQDAQQLAVLKEIYSHLHGLGVADRFVAAGLCLGGYLPIRAVLEDERLIGAISANPPAFRWTDAHRQQLARGLAAFRGPEAIYAKPVRDTPPGPLQAITDRVERAVASIELQARRLLGHVNVLWVFKRRAELADAAETLDQLGSTGALVLLLMSDSEEELVLRLLTQPKLATKLHRWPNIQLELLPTRDHNLRPLWIQEIVFARVSAALEELASQTA